ncbi:MAG: TadE family protein [Myxococcota bacterium]
MKRSLVEDEGGAVYAEFLIAFPPMLMMFLAMLQLGLMYSARLSVRHAAYRATRAAVVVIPDNPDNYGGENTYRIDYDSSGTGSGDPSGLVGMAMGKGSARLKAIRFAATMPLLGFAPNLGRMSGEESLADTLGGDTVDTFAGGLYGIAATSVTFPEEPASMSFRETFDRNEMVTTRVTYMMTCTMPIVTREPFNMCSAPLDFIIAAPDVVFEGLAGTIGGDVVDPWTELGFDTYRDWLRGREDMANGVEEMRFANWTLLAPFMLADQRFVILRAEASMPMQGAEYDFR